ncbi:HAD family hydrolase [Gracilibacillus caseinilyticus]|uniref:HAD family hydrolase n=1 Tax=Gracilibacillus caseinilyticus TaxID=2932256 RepID=A0ABY4EX16_9BACI|nr:HAD family hydrolase [Gracilibacillus caseinilyticus]UOQ48829.1 HAD family hydrolase [Gracilibacillus caseinilyticus]
MIKLFATDLDGTLLKHGNRIKTEDISAIELLKDSNIDFAIATGRMDRDILQVCEKINTPAHRISQNGAFVDTKSNERILANTFDIETSSALHHAISQFPNPFCVTTADEAYISVKTPEIEAMEKILYFPLVEGVDFADEYQENFLPSKYMLLGEQKDIVAFQADIHEKFHAVCESYLSDPRCVDIVPKGVSKAVGLIALAEYLAIKPDEIAVIGDSFNDIPMFEMTPNSFAMSTAPEAVRKKAANVVDNVHEAIAYVQQSVSTN